MRTTSLLLLALVAAASEPVNTSLCEIHKNPHRFNGKTVRIRAAVIGSFETSHLWDKTCEAYAWFQGGDHEPMLAGKEYARIDASADLDHPARLHWQPMPQIDQPLIVVKEDADLRRLKSLLSAKYVPEGKATCRYCPLNSVTATFTGRLDYTDGTWKAVRDKEGKVIGTIERGFGHLNANKFRFVMESVKQVDAVPIDPAVYREAEAKRKR